VIGSGTPAIPHTIEPHPAVALITCPALTVPRTGRTPVMRRCPTSNPVTFVYGWISTPARLAPRAKAHTTASWRMIPPGRW
jgi:hypothetical protein